MDQATQAVQGYPEAPAGEALSSHRVKVFFGLAVMIAAMGYFAFQAFQSATMYYLTVSELSQLGPTEDGRSVRVNGKLVEGSFVREPDSTLASFSITDGSVTMAAIHDGVVPDLFFNEHSEIILQGSYTAKGVFESQTVIVKCPSKYIAAE
jgi:cytochrome c-type biogenesis protein CcmE